MYRSDPAFIRECLPGIRGILDWYGRHVDSTGMLGAMPYWSYVDWSPRWPRGVPPRGNEGHSATISLLYAYALQHAAQLEEEVGVPGMGRAYRARADSVIGATRSRAWDASRRLFRDSPDASGYSQHTNVLALLTNAVPAQERCGLMERVLSDTSLAPATYYFGSYVFEALRVAGLADRYVELLAPWRTMLALGLTGRKADSASHRSSGGTPMTPNPSSMESPSYDRRAFLREVAVIGVSASVIGCLTRAAPGAGSSMKSSPTPLTVDEIGLQLYTVGDLLRQDFGGTIEQVAAIGYKRVEFAGYFNQPAEDVRALLDRLGMKSPSTHIGMDLLRRDLAGQIHIAQVIGHEYITIPSLGRTETPMNTADAWKRVAAECNEMGARVKAAGLKLAFHSHTGEFVDVGSGKTGMDVFVSETDPSVFSFEMDLGWARVANQDPVAWFRRYPARFRMWHIKDFENLAAAQARQAEAFRNPAARNGARGGAGASQSGRPAPLGAGDIDFKPILAAWREAGLEHFFIEQDGAGQWPGGSLAAITTSYRAMRELLST